MRPIPITAALVGAALAAWIVTAWRMRGMDVGPGADLGDAGWFLGVWVTMMSAMMLPSAAPMVLAFARVSGHRRATGGATSLPTWIFVAGYLLAWTAYGLVAYGMYRLLTTFDIRWLAWNESDPWIAGGAIAAAGIYQLVPLKEMCLRHCRTPLSFVVLGWKDGWLGALRMGCEHGLYCVGCCWGLMVVLFAVGVMSVFWMAVVAGVIFLEKVSRLGFRFSRAFAFVLLALGFLVALRPDSLLR